jgi:2,3-dihydroxybenzoate-AMP ligase
VTVLEGVVPYPTEAARRYRAAGYWTGQTFGDLLDASVAAHGGRTAVVGTAADGGGDVRWTYAELDARARSLAAGFADLGVAPGDRVVVWLPNVPELLEVVFGLTRLGALPVFALPAHRDSEVRYFAEHSDAVAVVTVAGHDRFDHQGAALAVADAVASVRRVVVAAPVGEVDERAVPIAAVRGVPVDTGARPGPNPSDVAFLQLSGGTTGLPKLIPRTHDDYLYSVRASADICGLTPDSVYMATLPAAHNYPLSSPGVLGALYAGSTVVLAPSPDPDTCFALVERERVTITGVVPPLAAGWVQAAARATADLSSLEVLQVGGAKCGTELAARIPPALGVRLQQVFGMAEGLVNYTRLDDPDELVATTQGRPISPDDEVRVVDPDDPAEPDVAPGEVGALLTRGPYTIRGYYRAAEHNAVAFSPDGFYRTGDLVRITPEGHLVVTGRVKEQINRGGEKIAPEEVENHLMAHPAVADAAVVGAADAFLGERTHAYVVPAEGAAEPPTSAELRRFVRARGVAAFKVPDRVEVVGEFPATGVGKTSKRALRTALAERLTAATDGAGVREGAPS